MHERLADWLEDRHPERMIELEAILGHHLERAHRLSLGARPGRRTHLRARATRRRDSWRRRGGGRCARARTPPRRACWAGRFAAARVGAGTACAASGDRRVAGGNREPRQAGEIYEEAWSALSAGERRVEGHARLGRAHVWFVAPRRSRPTQIVAETERAIRLLQRTGEQRGLAEPGGCWARRACTRGGRATASVRSSGRSGMSIPRPCRAAWNAISFALGDVPAGRPGAAGPRDRVRRASASPRRAPAACARWRPTCCTCSAPARAAGALRRSPRGADAPPLRSARTSACATWRSGPSAAWGGWSWRPAIRRPPSPRCERARDVLEEMGLNSSLAETAVPLAEALYAQGRFEEAESTLKVLKDEWAGGDASVARRGCRCAQSCWPPRLDAARGGDRRPRPANGARHRLAVPAGRHVPCTRRGDADRPGAGRRAGRPRTRRCASRRGRVTGRRARRAGRGRCGRAEPRAARGDPD